MNGINNNGAGPGPANQQVIGEVQDGAAQALAAETAQRQPLPQANQFGAVRDRLFHAMLVRVAVNYNRHVPLLGKRCIEFFCLITALLLFSLMVYVHHFFDKTDSNCLAAFADKWPRDGVLRVEVISNLEKFSVFEDKLLEKSHERESDGSNTTVYDLRRVLIGGPIALPKEMRNNKPKHNIRKKSDHWISFFTSENTLFSLFLKSDGNLKSKQSLEDIDFDHFNVDTQGVIDDSDSNFDYVVEYSLHYGLLKLSHSYRLEHHIPFLLVRLDPEIDICFGDWLSRMLMKYFIGYEDVLMTSVKALAENETDKGYLRDMITGEHYRFVTMGNPRASYFTALIVMLIFTFAISMLLRFSHHQIFLFIVDLLQMFELNQALVFPAAPLLTVILALVGMEAIMSEVFNDTSTAFYVILLVWIADQYDAICCQSPISRRHWLRFFYLYHYAFYAYQYRYNGQYGGLALLTSTFFILHSMVFFFHHYEMPLIVYHDRLQRIISDLQHNRPDHHPETANTSTVPGTSSTSVSPAPTRNVTNAIPENQNQFRDEVLSSPSITRITDRDIQSVVAENVLLMSSINQDSAVESGGDAIAIGEMDNVTLNDPLLAAGERTAREIVDMTIRGIFRPATATATNSSNNH